MSVCLDRKVFFFGRARCIAYHNQGFYHHHQRSFQLRVESIRGLHWLNSTSFCDWFRKLESLSQPIRCKTETNHDLVATFSRALGSLVVFSSSSHRLLKIFLKDISTIFLDFKHYKPKKDIVSTRCFAFTEQDEFKPGPACIEL